MTPDCLPHQVRASLFERIVDRAWALADEVLPTLDTYARRAEVAEVQRKAVAAEVAQGERTAHQLRQHVAMLTISHATVRRRAHQAELACFREQGARIATEKELEKTVAHRAKLQAELHATVEALKTARDHIDEVETKLAGVNSENELLAGQTRRLEKRVQADAALVAEAQGDVDRAAEERNELAQRLAALEEHFGRQAEELARAKEQLSLEEDEPGEPPGGGSSKARLRTKLEKALKDLEGLQKKADAEKLMALSKLDAELHATRDELDESANKLVLTERALAEAKERLVHLEREMQSQMHSRGLLTVTRSGLGPIPSGAVVGAVLGAGGDEVAQYGAEVAQLSAELERTSEQLGQLEAERGELLSLAVGIDSQTSRWLPEGHPEWLPDGQPHALDDAAARNVDLRGLLRRVGSRVRALGGALGGAPVGAPGGAPGASRDSAPAPPSTPREGHRPRDASGEGAVLGAEQGRTTMALEAALETARRAAAEAVAQAAAEMRQAAADSEEAARRHALETRHLEVEIAALRARGASEQKQIEEAYERGVADGLARGEGRLEAAKASASSANDTSRRMKDLVQGLASQVVALQQEVRRLKSSSGKQPTGDGSDPASYLAARADPKFDAGAVLSAQSRAIEKLGGSSASAVLGGSSASAVLGGGSASASLGAARRASAAAGRHHTRETLEADDEVAASRAAAARQHSSERGATATAATATAAAAAATAAATATAATHAAAALAANASSSAGSAGRRAERLTLRDLSNTERASLLGAEKAAWETNFQCGGKAGADKAAEAQRRERLLRERIGLLERAYGTVLDELTELRDAVRAAADARQRRIADLPASELRVEIRQLRHDAELVRVQSALESRELCARLLGELSISFEKEARWTADRIVRHVIADGRALPPDHPQATGRAAFATSGATVTVPTAAPSAPAGNGDGAPHHGAGAHHGAVAHSGAGAPSAAPGRLVTARQPRPASATRGGSGRFGVPARPASATCSRAPLATAAELLGAVPTCAPASTTHAATATAPRVAPTAGTGSTTKLAAAAGTANAVASASAAASANDAEPDAQLVLDVREEVESLKQCMHRALQRATRTLRGRLLPSKPTTLEDSGVPGAAVGAQQIRWLAQVCRVMLPHCLVCVFDPLSQDLESRYSPWTVLAEDAQALGVERDERIVLEKFDPYAAVAAAVEAAP